MKNQNRQKRDERRVLPQLTVLLMLLVSSCLPCAASSTGGSGSSTLACSGFSPKPCARTDTGTLSIGATSLTLGPTGNTGTPWIDPDFGERIVRVTDANTEAASYGCCLTNPSGEVNSWSILDSSLFSGDGGYRFRVADGGNNILYFTMDAKTMFVGQTSQITHSSNPNLLNNSNQDSKLKQNGDWSSVSPTVVYAQGATAATANWTIRYDFATDRFYDASGNPSTTPVAYIDWSTCPNLPVPLNGTYGTSFTVRQSDTVFGAALGGQSQGDGIYEFYATKASLTAPYTACYWYDTLHGTWGGTGQTATAVAGGVGQLLAPGTPTLSASPAGTVSYCAVVTNHTTVVDQTGSSTNAGDSLPSAETCATGSASATLTLTFASGWSNPSTLIVNGSSAVCTSDASPCHPYRIWMSSNASGSASGKEVLQNSGTSVSGPTFTIAATSLVTGTASPPTQSTAGYNIHQGQMSRGGTVTDEAYQQGGAHFWWTAGTGTVTACAQNGTDQCGGHSVTGQNVWVNAAGGTNGFATDTRTWSNAGSFTALQNPSGTGSASDNHFGWAYNQSASGDNLPVTQVWVTDSGGVNGNGSTALNSNPCTQSNGTWSNEVDMVGAGTGAGPVWRFAHTRGTGCAQPSANANAAFGDDPFGSVSQDGKFIEFNSVWAWQLGNSYVSATWTASHTYSAKSIIKDSNGNYEVTTSGGTSGTGSTSCGNAPCWSTTSGGATTDGTVTWTMITGCTDPNDPNWGSGNPGLGCRVDVFVVELR